MLCSKPSVAALGNLQEMPKYEDIKNAINNGNVSFSQRFKLFRSWESMIWVLMCRQPIGRSLYSNLIGYRMLLIDFYWLNLFKNVYFGLSHLDLTGTCHPIKLLSSPSMPFISFLLLLLVGRCCTCTTPNWNLFCTSYFEKFWFLDFYESSLSLARCLTLDVRCTFWIGFPSCYVLLSIMALQWIFLVRILLFSAKGYADMMLSTNYIDTLNYIFLFMSF